MTRLSLLIFSLCLALVACAQSFAPERLENPNIADRSQYVADPAALVSQEAKAQANRTLADLRNRTSAEVAVVVVPTTGDLTVEDYAERLFTKWGVGKSDKDNGVLILIVTDDHKTRIQTGYGAEGALPDISSKKIIDHTIIANMKTGNLDAAVTRSAEAVAAVLSDPELADELKSSRKDAWENDEAPVTAGDIGTFAAWVAGIMFLISLGYLGWTLRKSHRLDRYQKALLWHNERKTFWILAFLSLGMGLITVALAEFFYRRSRNNPMKCQTCGHKMRKLNEKEDNILLNPSQDLEERLGTVDYDVWECPECGSIEKFPFRTNQLRYKECPSCHTVAMCMVHDHTLQPATTLHAGAGEKVWQCQYCGNQHKTRYVIPKKPDPRAAALAAGAIMGASGRRGGGGFGGGFGGGSTGGGGASGSW